MVLHVNVSHFRKLKTSRTNLTLLRRATQYARKRRCLAPNTLHARIVFLPPLQSSNALSVLRLHLLETDEVGLQPPRLVITAVWSESLALRIHRSREPSESPVQTLSSRLRHAHLLLLCISKALLGFSAALLLALRHRYDSRLGLFTQACAGVAYCLVV